jgi:methylenetetrahydrofolate dehydrogenase (NADP+)/methenyltetrahydrofolate cyclohydrolase
MSAIVIDGAAIAREMREVITLKARTMVRTGKRHPCLAVILVGDDPASVTYVGLKKKALAECGMAGQDYRLPVTTSQQELLDLVARLNVDPQVHGILVQLPLPSQINETQILEAILPEKDVDGFHPVNMGKLLSDGEDAGGIIAATPRGILCLIDKAGIETKGKNAVIVGRSNIVGKPVAALLMSYKRSATVTLCHRQTRDLAYQTREADILISSAGSPHFITADMVKPGAAVIDVGAGHVSDPSRPSGWRLVGDVDYESVKEKAGWITPVPGGVGPMTITMLLQNTLDVAMQAEGVTHLLG